MIVTLTNKPETITFSNKWNKKLTYVFCKKYRGYNVYQEVTENKSCLFYCLIASDKEMAPSYFMKFADNKSVVRWRSMYDNYNQVIKILDNWIRNQ